MERGKLVRAALAALVTFTAGKALAAGPYDQAPVIIGKYWEQFRQRNCDGGDSCTVKFSEPPTGKLLTIKQIACTLRSDRAHTAEVRLGVQSQMLGVLRVKPLPFTLVATEAGPSYYYSLLVDTQYPVKGVVTRIDLSIPNPHEITQSRLECQISGNLSP